MSHDNTRSSLWISRLPGILHVICLLGERLCIFPQRSFRDSLEFCIIRYSDHNNVSYRPYVGVFTRDTGNNRVLPINLKVFNKADIINIVHK